VVAWATPDEAVTPLEACRLLEAEVELLEVELPEADGRVDDVEAPPVLDDAVAPGIVAALTAPRTPTDPTAAKAAATVRRFRSDRAASRARMWRSAGLVVSMWYRFLRPSEANVGEGCEVPERAGSDAG
jgi:hypothetical protein